MSPTPAAPSTRHGASPAAEEIERAFAHCERLASEHYENFPTASRLLPREMRRHVAAIYAFARTADDFADEERYAGQDRLALLDGWLERLRASETAAAGHPIFLALGQTIGSHRLPLEPFEDLLTAFRMDVTKTSYKTWNDVLAYCRFSANPVGRLMLLLFGHRDPRLHSLSDSICTALQLTNFWQDIGIDLDKGRCYIPQDDLRYHGVTAADLESRRATPAFVEMILFEVRRTRALFESGAALPDIVGGRLGFQLRLVAGGGTRILDRIEAVRGDIFTRRPKLTTADWGRLLLRAATPGSRSSGRP